MTRGLATVDRLLTLLAGLGLLVAGVAAILWAGGPLQHGDLGLSRVGMRPIGDTLDVGWLPDTVAQQWFPWAELGVGLVLGLFGLRWLLVHLPRRTVHRVALEGDVALGRLDADLGAVAASAADALSREQYIESATSRVVVERGTTVIELTASVPATATLGAVAQRVDGAAADLRQALGDACPAVRSWIHVGRP